MACFFFYVPKRLKAVLTAVSTHILMPLGCERRTENYEKTSREGMSTTAYFWWIKPYAYN